MKAPKKQRSSRAKSTSGPFIQRMNKNRHAQSEAAPFISPKHSAPIQTKLSINQPGDKYEQEADRMADHIMRRPNTQEEAPMISRMHAGAPVQRMCQDCQEEMQAPPGGDAHRTFEKATQGAPQSSEIIIQRKCSSCGGAIQMMADNSGSRFASEDLAQSLQQQKGRGTPLPAGIQTQMSQSFGTDFSEVNIHTDSNAVQMNRELNAKAFTHGSDIYFNQGMYQPGTNSGRRLLGHELTHVEQQRGNSKLNYPTIQRDVELKLDELIRVEDWKAYRLVDIYKDSQIMSLRRMYRMGILVRRAEKNIGKAGFSNEAFVYWKTQLYESQFQRQIDELYEKAYWHQAFGEKEQAEVYRNGAEELEKKSKVQLDEIREELDDFLNHRTGPDGLNPYRYETSEEKLRREIDEYREIAREFQEIIVVSLAEHHPLKLKNLAIAAATAGVGMAVGHWLKGGSSATGVGRASGVKSNIPSTKPGSQNLLSGNRLGDQRLLTTGKRGRLVPNALERHEIEQAQDIVSFRGGELVGAPRRRYPGIDGMLDNNPIALKRTESKSPVAVLRHASQAEDQVKNTFYSGRNVEVFIDARNIKKNTILDFAHGDNQDLLKITNQGVISSISIRTTDGWVRIVNGAITQRIK